MRARHFCCPRVLSPGFSYESATSPRVLPAPLFIGHPDCGRLAPGSPSAFCCVPALVQLLSSASYCRSSCPHPGFPAPTILTVSALIFPSHDCSPVLLCRRLSLAIQLSLQVPVPFPDQISDSRALNSPWTRPASLLPVTRCNRWTALSTSSLGLNGSSVHLTVSNFPASGISNSRLPKCPAPPRPLIHGEILCDCLLSLLD